MEYLKNLYLSVTNWLCLAKHSEEIAYLQKMLETKNIEYDQLSSCLTLVNKLFFAQAQELQAKGVNFARSMYQNELSALIQENIKLQRELGRWVEIEDRKFIKLEEKKNG